MHVANMFFLHFVCFVNLKESLNKKVKEYKEKMESENVLETKEMQAGLVLPNDCQNIELILFSVCFFIYS